MQTRTCLTCGETKPASAEFFYRCDSKNTKTIRRVCKVCRRKAERARHYRNKYGHLPGGEEAQQLRDNSTSCQICGSTSNLSVDHSHDKQYVRGVICMNCNVGLGHFKDSPVLLEAAMEYVITSDSHHGKRDQT